MISVTEKAAEHIKSQLQQRGKGVGIRLGVKTTGCSGLAYVIEFADEHNDDDNVFLDKGITLIINPKSCLLYTSPSPRDVEESRMPSSA